MFSNCPMTCALRGNPGRCRRKALVPKPLHGAPTAKQSPFRRDNYGNLKLGWRGGKESLEFAGKGTRTLAFSRQGRLAYETGDWDADIWRLELNPVHKAEKPPERLISSTRREIDAQYSSDGKRIAFGSERSGNSEIWVCQSDGSKPVQVTSFGDRYLTDPFWSPDGTRSGFQGQRGRSSTGLGC